MNIKNLLVLVLLVTSIAANKTPEELVCIRKCLIERCGKFSCDKTRPEWWQCEDGCYEDCYHEFHY
jgi:hypothetical protein